MLTNQPILRFEAQDPPTTEFPSASGVWATMEDEMMWSSLFPDFQSELWTEALQSSATVSTSAQEEL